jgi:methylenetetrahydrofolate reductase (NADPH)
VRHIVALRGDMPEQGAPYCAHPCGYQSTPELVAGIRRVASFEISVGTYPERHPDSASLDLDVDLLKAKVEAGASRAIGQFSFDMAAVVRFRDRAHARGVSVPLVPGLMPSTNFNGVLRMATRCGAAIPHWLRQLYDGLEEDVESRKAIAAAVLAEQVEQLRREGFDQFHFYTLNQADLTYAACRLLGIRERRPREEQVS